MSRVILLHASVLRKWRHESRLQGSAGARRAAAQRCRLPIFRPLQVASRQAGSGGNGGGGFSGLPKGSIGAAGAFFGVAATAYALKESLWTGARCAVWQRVCS
jgi:hypothetical protein